MKFAALAVSLSLLVAALPARAACNCNIYPFQPQACVVYCSSEALARVTRDSDARELLKQMGYRRSQTNVLLEAGGDAGRIRELLESDVRLGTPLERSLDAASLQARRLGLEAIQAEGY